MHRFYDEGKVNALCFFCPTIQITEALVVITIRVQVKLSDYVS